MGQFPFHFGANVANVSQVSQNTEQCMSCYHPAYILKSKDVYIKSLFCKS